jgi:hypothetical protein
MFSRKAREGISKTVLPQHKRLALGGLAGLLVVALVGVAFFRANAVSAAHPQAANAPSQIISTGTRTDAQVGHAAYLGTRDAATIPQGQPYHGTTAVPLRTLRKKGATAQPGIHSPAPTGATAPAISNTPNPETPLPTSTIQGLAQNATNGLTPADMGLAAGDGYIVQAVNASITVWNLSGVQQKGWPKTAQAFFGASSSTFMYDPRAIFDSINGRFIILFDENGGTAPGKYTSNYYVAVSATPNPTGAWHLYNFFVGENLATTNAAFADFPIMGLDELALYFTGNHFYFTANNQGFADSFLGFVPITQIESGASSLSYHVFNALTTSTGAAFSVAPAVTYGSPRAETLVDTDANCSTAICNTYDVWALSNPWGTPRLTDVKITGPNWSQQPPANQPGTNGANSIDAGDPRVSGIPVFRGGTLYFANGTGFANGTATVAAVQWVALGIGFDTGNAACGTVPNNCVDIVSSYVRDSGLLGYSGSGDAYDPSLSVTTDGDIVMTYTYSSLTFGPIATVYGHRSTTPLGTIGTYAHTVNASFSNHFYAQTRWGDYSAVALDYASCTSAGCFRLWFSDMYVRSDGTWGTTISAETYNIFQP